MKPSERLKEIEHENVMSGGDRDLSWLIARVKRLTEALEWYVNDESVFPGYRVNARKALEEET